MDNQFRGFIPIKGGSKPIRMNIGGGGAPSGKRIPPDQRLKKIMNVIQGLMKGGKKGGKGGQKGGKGGKRPSKATKQPVQTEGKPVLPNLPREDKPQEGQAMATPPKKEMPVEQGQPVLPNLPEQDAKLDQIQQQGEVPAPEGPVPNMPEAPEQLSASQEIRQMTSEMDDAELDTFMDGLSDEETDELLRVMEEEDAANVEEQPAPEPEIEVEEPEIEEEDDEPLE